MCLPSTVNSFQEPSGRDACTIRTYSHALFSLLFQKRAEAFGALVKSARFSIIQPKPPTPSSNKKRIKSFHQTIRSVVIAHHYHQPVTPLPSRCCFSVNMLVVTCTAFSIWRISSWLKWFSWEQYFRNRFQNKKIERCCKIVFAQRGNTYYTDQRFQVSHIHSAKLVSHNNAFLL